MHRIDSDGNLAGFWTEGNPGIGQQATVISDDFMNDVQENLSQCIEGAGLTLVKGQYDQLLQAVKVLANNAVKGIGPQNLGMTVSAGVITIHAADGSALSASNPAYVTLPSKDNPGIINTVQLTANVSWQDGNATSDMTGQIWGKQSGDDWNQPAPHFIYFCYNETQDRAEFAVSKDWMRNKTPSLAARVGYKGNPSTNNSDSDFWFASSTAVAADFATEQACLLIGSLEATNNASDEVFFSAIEHEQTGIGRYPWGVKYTKPTGLYGADAGQVVHDFGGDTPPHFGNIEQFYVIDQSGFVTEQIHLWDDGGQDGAGASSMWLYLAYENQTAVDNIGENSTQNAVNTVFNGGATDYFCLTRTNINQDRSVGFWRLDTGTKVVLTVGTVTAGGRRFEIQNYKYKAFDRG